MIPFLLFSYLNKQSWLAQRNTVTRSIISIDTMEGRAGSSPHFDNVSNPPKGYSEDHHVQ